MIALWRVTFTWNERLGLHRVVERDLTNLFEAPDRPRAIWDGLRWVRNRRKAFEIQTVTSIRIEPYYIGVVMPDGYLATGTAFLADVFEWKVDTHIHTFAELFEDYEPFTEAHHVRHHPSPDHHAPPAQAAQ